MSDLPEPLTPAVPDSEAGLGTFHSVGWFLKQAFDDRAQGLGERMSKRQQEQHE